MMTLNNQNAIVQAVQAVRAALRAYLPPDGISRDEYISRILAAYNKEQAVELARFNHHPDPATDFCVEVEELLAIATSAKMGLTGMGHEEDCEGYAPRYRKAMEFVVGGDIAAIKAQAVLRDLPENVL